MRNKTLIFAFGLLLFAFLYGCSAAENSLGALGSTHRHIDIKMYLLGEEVDFSQQKYQLRSQEVHFENGDGDVLHTHATGVTLGHMLGTLGMVIDEQCLTLDTGNKYCTDGNAELKVYAKGPATSWSMLPVPQDRIFQHNDKMLITYGTEDGEGIRLQLESVTNKAATT